jgi:Tol biopolymer transport system component
MRNTTDPVWLTRLDPGGSYSYREAKWSPNSGQIVFTRREVVSGDPVYEKTRSSEIFVMDVGTREVRRLTNNDYFDLAPVWSPDGGRIAYIRDEAVYSDQPENDVTTGSIRVMNSDGTDDKEIFSCPYGCWWLAWSPLDDRIAFPMRLSEHMPGKTVDGPPSEIFLINSDGSDLQQVTKGDGPALQPRWSPDGRRIVFVRSDLKSIRVLDVQSQVETSFTVGELIGAQDPIWSPDQSGIIFSAAQPERRLAQLYFLRLADGSISPLSYETSDMPELYQYEPDWSPDGAKLIFNANLSELYLVNASSVELPR